MNAKVFQIFLVCCLASVTLAMPKSDEDMTKLIAECQKSSGASDAEKDIIEKNGEVTTAAGKCMQACILEEIGMYKDGKVVMTDALKKATASDPKLAEMVKAVAEQCTTTQTDKCEMAFELHNCVNDIKKKLGITAKPLTT